MVDLDRYHRAPVDTAESQPVNQKCWFHASLTLIGGAFLLMFVSIVATSSSIVEVHNAKLDESTNLRGLTSLKSGLAKPIVPLPVKNLHSQDKLCRHGLLLFGKRLPQLPRWSHAPCAGYEIELEQQGGDSDQQEQWKEAEMETDSRGRSVALTGGIQRESVQSEGKTATKKDEGGEAEWDPSGLFQNTQVVEDLIDRRAMTKKQELETMQLRREEKAAENLEKKRMQARMSREPPQGNHTAMFEYLTRVPLDELPFEVARAKPSLDDGFFAYLSELSSQVKLEGTIMGNKKGGQIDALAKIIQTELQKIQAKQQELTAPIERMKKLLMAPDKLAMIGEMGELGEIDQPLLDLLKLNQETAEKAGEDQKANFIGKIILRCEPLLKTREKIVEDKSMQKDVVDAIFEVDINRGNYSEQEKALQVKRSEKKTKEQLEEEKNAKKAAVYLPKEAGDATSLLDDLVGSAQRKKAEFEEKVQRKRSEQQQFEKTMAETMEQQGMGDEQREEEGEDKKMPTDAEIEDNLMMDKGELGGFEKTESGVYMPK